MKILSSILVIFGFTGAYARPSEKPVFGRTATTTVQALFGNKGDTVKLRLDVKTHSEESDGESWYVTLENSSARSSCTYLATVTKFYVGDADPGQISAQVDVRYTGCK